ncbi:FadR/GntR family transcriptional regulator [Fulvimarina sp. MAC8]|uniref:FadR/GntR family transcriptional regulator n=1 Tax=Fulvimarina sp. MAC8 TaxID=3162874 RepID=UPI0032EF2929
MSRSSFVLNNAPELQQAIVRQSVRHAVAAKIGAMIASGILQVGDGLPSERDLAGALQVSRETIRGGIQILAAKGLLEVVHGAGTKVVSADVETEFTGLRQTQAINEYGIDHIHTSRLLVEREVVGIASQEIDAEAIGFLEQSLKAQVKAIADPMRFLIIDREFHLAIYRSCSNRVLGDFVSDLYGYMMSYRRLAMSKSGAIEKSYDDHRAIVEALKRHDREAVVSAFDIHLDRIYRTTKTVIADVGEEGSSDQASEEGVPPRLSA